jgi:hypothetical protein
MENEYPTSSEREIFLLENQQTTGSDKKRDFRLLGEFPRGFLMPGMNA